LLFLIPRRALFARVSKDAVKVRATWFEMPAQQARLLTREGLLARHA
jgi:hypothetical protein